MSSVVHALAAHACAARVYGVYEHAIGTHLTNFFFDGARADLTKGLSMSPAFQVTHSFALGSQTAPSSYNLGAVFATDEASPTIRDVSYHAETLIATLELGSATRRY